MNIPQYDWIWLIIGSRIQLLRKEQGLTQEFLAAQVGLTRTSITNLESGKQRVNLETLYDIAEWLDVEIYDLLPRLQYRRS